MACPIRYNGTLCACPPGQLVDPTTNGCSLFSAASGMETDGGVDTYTALFPETIFAFDQIRKLTQSQAVFLETTLLLLTSWLVFCFFLRFMDLGDGRTVWFNLRCWLTRLDFSFSTRHWLDDQKVVTKRKTELGGTFSMASWILFIGLLAALLYQIITKRSIEVHNVRPTNAPDLASFANDIEFNITTISTMSCSNLRDLDTLLTGNPVFTDRRIAPLSSFANYTCLNSTKGPTMSLKCRQCQLTPDNMFISWKYADVPTVPAVAVGFEFNVSTVADEKHVSFVSGVLRSEDRREGTFRGVGPNVFKFNLFPRVYRNLKGLRIIQPRFHDFVSGSCIRDASELRASLERPGDGVIDMTLYINFVSDYVIEIDDRNIMGPVSFLADVGGIYCISITLFFFFLVQCEYRIKSLRDEDGTIMKIRNKRKAQQHWDKLRRYVMYTWGFKNNPLSMRRNGSSGYCNPLSMRRNGSSHKQLTRLDPIISFNKKPTSPAQKKASKLKVAKSDVYAGDAQTLSLGDDTVPPLPSLEVKEGWEKDVCAVEKNVQRLYEYNVMVGQKLASLLLHLPTSPPNQDLNISLLP